MLYREIIAVCSQIHTKHINALCGQDVELLNVKGLISILILAFYLRLDLPSGLLPSYAYSTNTTIWYRNVWASRVVRVF
jgi:uncharacterized membrane protein YGL010W